MLAKRIIPCLDVKDGRTVKGTEFVDLRDAGDPVELAARYSAEGADELVLLDISATQEGRSTFLQVVESVGEAIRIPFTVGGGVARVETVQRALDAGADKVSLNTAAVRDPDLISACARAVGMQSVVVSIDARRAGTGWEVWLAGGSLPSGRDALVWAREAVDRGAGELLITSMDRDGTRSGYELDLLRAIAGTVPVPVIASGGAGAYEHFFDAFVLGGADAALAAGLFHYRDMSIGSVKRALHARGIPVRL